MEKIRTIITGTTGMVGEGVLYECLQHPAVEAVLVINRKPCGYEHAKLKEIIYADFLDFSPIEAELAGYNACFFCLGVSSVGMDKEQYYRMTYTLTLHVAETLSRLNQNMTFCYVSGAGTNTSEKGGSNWSRVKGKTEIDLMKLPFAQVFNFRPGFIKATPGLKYTNSLYKYVSWLYPIGRALFPGGFCTLKELGLAMIHTLSYQNQRKAVEVKEIVAMAKE
jgi:hypothetical protein